MRKNLIIGNWKMNGSLEQNEALLHVLAGAVVPENLTVAVCVPFPYLAQSATILKDTCFFVGAQTVSEFDDGAYTGEVSTNMLVDFGCRYVIVGHSERRQLFCEKNLQIAKKAKKVIDAGMIPIVCIGETEDERDSGLTHAVVSEQLSAVLELLGSQASNMVLAYEPIWAIGTGKTPTPAQAQGVHTQLRAQLIAASVGDIPIIYGGSMKPDNAHDLLAESDIDGGLIGGASLIAEEFLEIINVAKNLNTNI
ncbi:MAG: triose-phosphate isomerase [Saezia sp.]